MTLKWYHLALLAITVSLLAFFFLWNPTSNEHPPVFEPPPVSERQGGKVRAPMTPQVTQEDTQVGSVSKRKLSPLFSSLPTVTESLEMNPDIHPSITMFHAMFADKSLFEDDPQLKRFLEVFSSPEYNELISNPLTREEYDAFWTENGLYRDPDRFRKKFREYFPSGEPEDYEPEMRAYLLELAKGIPDEELDAHKARLRSAFREPRILAWKAGQFQGRGGAFKNPGWGAWFNSTLDARDRTPIPPAFSEAPIEVPLHEPMPGRSIESPIEPQPTKNFESTINTGTPTSADDSHHTTSREPAPPVNIRDAFDAVKLPEIPTEESIASQLSSQLPPERLSPQRVATAMQTLSQYGPEEGLRRLKESDPEIATLIEKSMQSNTETD